MGSVWGALIRPSHHHWMQSRKGNRDNVREFWEKASCKQSFLKVSLFVRWVTLFTEVVLRSMSMYLYSQVLGSEVELRSSIFPACCKLYLKWCSVNSPLSNFSSFIWSLWETFWDWNNETETWKWLSKEVCETNFLLRGISVSLVETGATIMT